MCACMCLSLSICLSLYSTGTVLGGSSFATGGGASYLCVPLDPQYDTLTPNYFDGSLLYNVRYRNTDNGIFSNPSESRTVPCARCYTIDRPAVMVIPAFRTCPKDWTKEYGGRYISLRA